MLILILSGYKKTNYRNVNIYIDFTDFSDIPINNQDTSLVYYIIHKYLYYNKIPYCYKNSKSQIYLQVLCHDNTHM